MFCQVKKGKIRLFVPHPLHAVLCRSVVENNKHPNLQIKRRSEGGGGGVQIVLFSEVTPFEDYDSTILLAIVVRIVITHLT